MKWELPDGVTSHLRSSAVADWQPTFAVSE
jgi:hypothetical protein